MSIDVVEATIADLRSALEDGRTTSVELVRAYRDRIERYDRNGIRLASVVVDDPDAIAQAEESDARRRAGAVLGPLDGIPYTAKDSFMVRGLTVAAGSPAFAELVATRDAFSIERLRAAGCILIGLTNMPPMANGGMQRGLYGRAESPYSAEFLTSAFASGSSNGSGTATAASFAAFGLAEETWSSGRAPASCNALCAYTPSRGVISVRGNWPLVPTMDVVVPHTRTMADLLEILDVLVVDDPETRGDLWRRQTAVPLRRPSELRPSSFPSLAAGPDALRGLRLGVPAMYLGRDPEAGTGPGIGGPTGRRILPRPSVLDLWDAMRRDLEAAGATVVETDFPVVSRYEADRAGAVSIADAVPAGFLEVELGELAIHAWDDFLAANGQPGLDALALVDGPRISPPPPGALPDRYGEPDVDLADYVVRAQRDGAPDPLEGPRGALVAEGLRALERIRRADLEEWMDELGLDAVVFPAMADVGRADADVNEASAVDAWRNGVWVANGNLALRHLGIPTVTVPMGTMADIGMPVGLTIAGRADDDLRLLTWASAVEATRPRRTPPPRSP